MIKILKDIEENERSSNLINKEQNLYKYNIYNNNIRNQANKNIQISKKKFILYINIIIIIMKI